jgi:hypothetical protein
MRDQRPDPLWRTRPGRSRRSALLIIVGAVAVYVALIATHAPGSCSVPGGGPCTGGAILGRVTPIAPPAPAVCKAEMHRWGYSSSFSDQACRQGRRRPWFYAVITNTTDSTTAVLCDVDAYQHSERIARNVVLPISIVKAPGVMVIGAHFHRNVLWYFDPHDAPATVADATHFVTHCRTNPHPPT